MMLYGMSIVVCINFLLISVWCIIRVSVNFKMNLIVIEIVVIVSVIVSVVY